MLARNFMSINIRHILERSKQSLLLAATGAALSLTLSASAAVDVQLDVSEVPELQAWGDKAKKLCEEWSPKILDLLPSEGFKGADTVYLKFSKDMKGVAATGGDHITVSASYVKHATNDFGMVIHELVHVVQAYPPHKKGFQSPGWLVEGIADYIRLFKFEPDAPRPAIDPAKASYRDAYKTTAIFLDWASRKYDKDLVAKLNRPLRAGEFKIQLFTEITGKDVDALWKEFTDSLPQKQE